MSSRRAAIVMAMVGRRRRIMGLWLALLAATLAATALAPLAAAQPVELGGAL